MTQLVQNDAQLVTTLSCEEWINLEDGWINLEDEWMNLGDEWMNLKDE